MVLSAQVGTLIPGIRESGQRIAAGRMGHPHGPVQRHTSVPRQRYPSAEGSKQFAVSAGHRRMFQFLGGNTGAAQGLDHMIDNTKSVTWISECLATTLKSPSCADPTWGWLRADQRSSPLPMSCPEGALFRIVSLGLMRSGPQAARHPNASHIELPHTDPAGRIASARPLNGRTKTRPWR
jgi:hypothetical protein